MTKPSSNEPPWEADPVDLTESEQRSYLKPCTDFTVYWENVVTESLDDPTSPHAEAQRDTKSKNTQVKLKLPGANSTVEARACICSCYKRLYVSGTFRSQKEEPKLYVRKRNLSWQCSTWSSFDVTHNVPKFPIETTKYVDAMWKRIRPYASQGPLSGLVVFSGGTKAAKSELAKAFALEAIRRAATECGRHDRLPHLVSYEEPIESWRLSTRTKRCSKGSPKDRGKLLHCKPSQALEFGFCFTPREKSTDVESLAVALTDAKRQTPACFYIGEVRDPGEWKQIIEFAGTGHLVVATTHAARLNETVARIIRGNEAETPAARRNVGGYLAACIHLRSGELKLKSHKKMNAVFPTMWINRGAALSSLVADGLSSVTPNGDYDLSKYQFLQKLFADESSTAHRLSNELRQALLAEAIRLDALDLLQ